MNHYQIVEGVQPCSVGALVNENANDMGIDRLLPLKCAQNQ